MVVYLSAGYSLELQPFLVEHYGREAPVAVVHKASRPDECVVRTTAGNLVSAMAEHNICSHSVILAGSAISLNQPSPNPLVAGRRAAHGSDGDKRGLLTSA
jgi:precorrin-4/cobalt-precorrin-4 C11-methyltransferase